MRRSIPSLFILFAAISSLGASYRSAHFVVEAPTAKVAKQVGEAAEHLRKELAMKWLGKEMPDWSTPYPLTVTLTNNGSGGTSSFAFDKGRILSQESHVEGTLDRVLDSLVPHELTHVVLAHHLALQCRVGPTKEPPS